LEELNLSGGFFSASHWLQIEQKGEKLDSTLLYNQLELLPDAFCELSSLRLLDLHNCKLKELPTHFGKLTNLEKLHIQGNLLYFLPESMSEMLALEYLDAARNKLISLPFEIGALGQLKQLFLLEQILFLIQFNFLRLFSQITTMMLQ
jgi:Leucine-rich repeat (LRR) protein